MSALSIINLLLYIPFFLMVVYLLIFALASRIKSSDAVYHSLVSKQNRMVVLIPAYKEDKVIMDTVNAALNQDYDKHRFDVIVISDHMTAETDEKIIDLGGKVINIPFPDSSKAKALNYAFNQLKHEEYDIVIILDGDNLIVSGFLSAINDSFNYGWKAIQAHRTAKNTDTEVALLDAISEEINNSIFRKGHVALGLSSALIGSGMAFDYGWFRENVPALITVGEDKDLELILIRQHIPVLYLDHLYVYDEKTRKEDGLYNQRRRWIAAQLGSLRTALPDLPGELLKGNWNYLDKVYQWTFLPRVLLLGWTGFMTLFTCLLFPVYAWQWTSLFILLLIALLLAVPSRLMDKRLLKAIVKLPKIFFLITMGFLRTKGASKQFIHTDRS